MTKFQGKKAHFGRIYKKQFLLKAGTKSDCATWTVRYKKRDYNTGEADPLAAERFLLRLATGDTAPAKPQARMTAPETLSPAHVLMDKLFDLRDANAHRKGIHTADESKGRVTLHLRPFFGTMQAAALTSADIEQYMDKRLAEGAANATLNKELAMLKRSLRLGIRHKLITTRPEMEMQDVRRNVRKGFVDRDQYWRLRAAMPSHLEALFVVAYHTGARRGELLQLSMADVDLRHRQIHLYPDATKSGDGRIIPILKGDMEDAIRKQIERTRRFFPGCEWIFNKDGERIQTFYKAWATAVDKAQLPNLIFHDLRRSGARNLARAGVDQAVRMKITGHKTQSMDLRYNITDGKDLLIAAEKATAYLAELDVAAPAASALVS